jgi:hypothetical protein
LKGDAERRDSKIENLETAIEELVKAHEDQIESISREV